MALHCLVTGCQPGHSLMFHYFGHGSRQRNYNGDGINGHDEALCPLDFKTQGMILDDEINATIARPLPHGVKLQAVLDACHSGTVLDLPYLWRLDSMFGRIIARVQAYVKDLMVEKSSRLVVVMIAKAQLIHLQAFSMNAPTGVMMYCFIRPIERRQASTYGSLLSSMREAIRNTAKDHTGGGFVTSLLNMLVNGGSLSKALGQEPQLTASESFDVHMKPCSL